MSPGQTIYAVARLAAGALRMLPMLVYESVALALGARRFRRSMKSAMLDHGVPEQYAEELAARMTCLGRRACQMGGHSIPDSFWRDTLPRRRRRQ